MMRKERGKYNGIGHFTVKYVYSHLRTVMTAVLCSLLTAVVLVLYGIPLEALRYPGVLCAVTIAAGAGNGWLHEWKKHRCLSEQAGCDCQITENLPQAETALETDYQEIIGRLWEQLEQTRAEDEKRYRDMIDYYTVWVHQIKLPIASMGLALQKEDTPMAGELSMELSRIEQYVEMVLCYLRLDSDTTDYVFEMCEMDVLIRQAVKKYAGSFIRKRIRLKYEPTEACVVTDKKWLLFVLEQVLSNAIKYTPAGEISICMDENVLKIKDTGIGIAPQDLPRIFEKGYTGYNGRSQCKSSGLGLYLCRRICENMGHVISAESIPDCGTTVSIRFQDAVRMAE